MSTDIFSKLVSNWPSAIVARSEVGKFSGGLLHPRTLANLDSQGLGPVGRIRIGRMIAYPVEELATWMRQRSRPVDSQE